MIADEQATQQRLGDGPPRRYRDIVPLAGGTTYGKTPMSIPQPDARRKARKIPHGTSPSPTPCPACGSGMILRRNSKSGEAFWGCSLYPQCLGTRRAGELGQQLPLPGLNEVVALHQELALLRRQCQIQREQLGETLMDLHQATNERDAARRALALAEVRIAGLTLQLAHTQTTAPLPDWLDRELKRLLTVGHPDKWSAGQDAVTLANEVASTINTLRQKLVEVR